MKRKILIAALSACLCGCQRHEQSSGNVPEKIEAAFKQLHPNATVLSWKDESKTWEAKYQEGNQTGAASFDLNGLFAESEVVIDESALPNAGASVKEYLRVTYPDEIIQRCEKVMTASGKVTYEIQITREEIIFDADGKYVGVEPD